MGMFYFNYVSVFLICNGINDCVERFLLHGYATLYFD